jgi:hypothetical protein
MTAHLIAGEGFHPTIQVFGKIAKQLPAFIGALPALGLLPFGLLGQQLAALHVFRRVAQNLAHLLAHAQTRTMQANPDSSLLVGRESAQSARSSTPPYREARERCAEAPGCEELPDATDGAARRGADCPQGSRPHPEQSSQLRLVRHQFIQREGVDRSVSRLAAHAPAAVSGDGIKPDSKLLRF